MSVLGSDFLRHHHLLVDIVGSRHLDASSSLLSTTEEFRDLLAEYPDVISSKGFSGTVPKHPVCHSWTTSFYYSQKVGW